MLAKRNLLFACAILVTTTGAGVLARDATSWKPADNPLFTRWADDVDPAAPLPEYPRPQFRRDRWQNLNGLWDYAVRPREADRGDDFDGKILVPFAIESALSGVKREVGRENRLWYRRHFTAPELDEGERLLLHFGAVDWHAVVWLNDRKLGEHQGGYDDFSFDITDSLRDGEKQELVVAVWDPTDAGYQPRGKQVANPRGIWYTSVTGIWQTVWLEPVPADRIESVKITPRVDRSSVLLEFAARSSGADVEIEATVRKGESEVSKASIALSGAPDASGSLSRRLSIELPVRDARLWSPEDPFLYDLALTLSRGGEVVDRVDSYFGMRKIEIATDHTGFNRLVLNGKPLFQYGPLDQGWWPDGLYTAPTDAALRHDLEVTRKLGFNMLRKHVKIEPARLYYHCDRLGLLVWQDMPNGDGHIGRDQPDLERTEESASNFRREYRELIDEHYNHPCIVVWVPFNEGWGQFQTDEVLAWTREYDPTRLVDGPSGWADRGTGDMHDMHSYPGPGMPEPEDDRAVVLGEFGGLGLPLEDHLWWTDRRNWGYRTYRTREELQQNYETLLRKLRPLIARGLAAAVYTQTTDVEGEVNGLMTYDRDVIKFDAERLRELHARLYEPPPIIEVRTVLPTSRHKAQEWSYTTDEPSEDWFSPGFDASDWKRGQAGFGTEGTPGAVVRTEWNTPDIWLRREFVLEGTLPQAPHWLLHHDEDVEIYLNGKLAASVSGYVVDYAEVEFSPDTASLLRRGKNVIAVHCHQTGGGQYIDVGLIDVKESHPGSDSATEAETK